MFVRFGALRRLQQLFCGTRSRGPGKGRDGVVILVILSFFNRDLHALRPEASADYIHMFWQSLARSKVRPRYSSEHLVNKTVHATCKGVVDTRVVSAMVAV